MRYPLLSLLVLLMAAPAFAAEGKNHIDPAVAAEAFETKDNNFYIKLDPMVLPIINERGVSEVVSMLVALEVPDQKTVEKVSKSVPRLSDAYMRALYGHIDKSVYRNGHFLDVTKIKMKLIAVTDAMLGPGVVRDVLIQGLNQRHYN